MPLLTGFMKNGYFVSVIFSESLFDINHWLMHRMFSNCWVNIWNKYLMSWCVKNNLVSSANNFGSNMFKAFFKSFAYKRNRSGPKIEPCGNRSWSSLSLFFLFHWLEWIFSYFRGSSWLIHDFCPLYHIVPIYWEQWGSLQCHKPSIGQWVHQVYICYFQRFNYRIGQISL